MGRSARGLQAAGTVVAVVAMSLVHAAVHGYDYAASRRLAWSMAYVLLLLVASYGVGLPDVTRTRRSAAMAAVAGTFAAAVGISLLQLMLGSALLPRFVVFATPAVLVPLYVLCAALANDGRTRAADRDRIVAVVSQADAAFLTDELAVNPERPAVLVAVIDPTEAAVSTPGTQPLIDLVSATDATAVVLDRAAQADESIVAQAARIHESGVRVRTLSLWYDEWLGKLPLGELERVSLMFDIGEIHRARYGRQKRIMDVAAGTVGLVALAVAVPVVAAANLLGNRGPLFYRQRRVGKNGEEFEILKFRSMRQPNGDAPPDTAWTADADPRVTPFGRWMRRLHLDELPQVVNILRGDLSIVGPRPEQPTYVAELTEKIPFYRLRHLVRPGLTGWAQVKYPYGATESDALEKLQYEFYYLRHQSLTLDVRIIGRTIRTVIGREGK